jgi:predicted acylesterase/phospholipase RssA
MRMIPPRRLLFSGGGVRVVSYLGALQVFQERKLLDHVREFCGVSAGGIVALLLALGYSFHVMERFCFEFDFSTMHSFELETMFESIEHLGINSGDSIKTLIQKILRHKGFGPETTFQDLHASGRVKGYRIWASDIQYLRLVEFSLEKTPNIPIVTALYASMALPMYFIPVRHPETQTLLLDGGVLDNYPICMLSDEEIEETIGFVFEYSTLPVDVKDMSSLFSLLLSGYYMPTYQSQIKKYKHRTVVLLCQEFASTNFEASIEDRKRLSDTGRKAALEFLSVPKLPICRRRNSVS